LFLWVSSCILGIWLFALAGLVITYLVACWLLHFSVASGLVLLPIVPLTVLSLTGVDALIGSHARDVQTTTIYAQAVIGVATFLAPAMVLPESLPAFLRVCAQLIPTTSVAAIFRAALEARYDQEFMINSLILLGFTTCSLALAQRKLDWRLA
jgi:ABC-type multidrug transport system permease subunit